MREIKAEDISKTVERLCIQANRELPADVVRAINAASHNEPWKGAAETLRLLGKNMDIAREKQLPVCQDTGMMTPEPMSLMTVGREPKMPEPIMAPIPVAIQPSRPSFFVLSFI